MLFENRLIGSKNTRKREVAGQPHESNMLRSFIFTTMTCCVGSDARVPDDSLIPSLFLASSFLFRFFRKGVGTTQRTFLFVSPN